MAQGVEDQLKALLEKVDRLLHLVETRLREPRQRASGTGSKKTSPLLLEADEITHHQKHFEELYGIWEAGEELQVQNELEKMAADELRRFADANNLNVTSKTPKQKILQLIAGRFRERRQLTKSHFSNRSPMG